MDGLQGIAKQAKAAGVRVAWLTPSPVEKSETGPALVGYNETLEKYSEGVKKVAIAEGAAVCRPVPSLRGDPGQGPRGQPHQPHRRRRCRPPRPAGPGRDGLGDPQGARLPAPGFPAEIDAAAGKVAKADNCKVQEVAAKDGGLKFQRLDQALPFFPAEAKSILKLAPILDELNEYGLKVTGLEAGRQYNILIDGKKVAQHSGAELAEGLNLAAAVLEAGPIAEQVNAAWKALTAKNQFHHDQIYNAFLRSPPAIPDWLGLKPEEVESKRQAAFQKRLAQYPEMQQAVRQALAPRPHDFEIVPAK